MQNIAKDIQDPNVPRHTLSEVRSSQARAYKLLQQFRTRKKTDGWHRWPNMDRVYNMLCQELSGICEDMFLYYDDIACGDSAMELVTEQRIDWADKDRVINNTTLIAKVCADLNLAQPGRDWKHGTQIIECATWDPLGHDIDDDTEIDDDEEPYDRRETWAKPFYCFWPDAEIDEIINAESSTDFCKMHIITRQDNHGYYDNEGAHIRGHLFPFDRDFKGDLAEGRDQWVPWYWDALIAMRTIEREINGISHLVPEITTMKNKFDAFARIITKDFSAHISDDIAALACPAGTSQTTEIKPEDAKKLSHPAPEKKPQELSKLVRKIPRVTDDIPF